MYIKVYGMCGLDCISGKWFDYYHSSQTNSFYVNQEMIGILSQGFHGLYTAKVNVSCYVVFGKCTGLLFFFVSGAGMWEVVVRQV